MRVIAGLLRSRPLRAPKGQVTRPTTDRVRESLFAVIGDVQGMRVLDLYAGSGALAIEAISRGANAAVCVESRRAAIAAIGENLASLGIGERVEVLGRPVGDAARAILERGPFDVVLADPPWADVGEGSFLRAIGPLLSRADALLAEGGVVVVEHAARDTPPDLAPLARDETRRWGDTAASFYRRSAP